MNATEPTRCALVRDDNGGLVVRRFPAEVAAEHNAARDVTLPDPVQVQSVAGLGRGEIRHSKMAKALGVSTTMIRAQYRRGGLPGAKEHSANILVVPVRLLRLAEAYGLRGVERMAKAGML